MFTYTYNGSVIDRATIAGIVGGRRLSDVIEVIAAGNGVYRSGAVVVTYGK
jgi:hypothetical protein